ncbi:energy transducer TonB [Epilithonimonas lactis]|uniref:TonB-like protein n=1 Tax=Epilithonimonas lactis TaxID=421072 RepID=A0A085BMC6_9FLAO|nr:hypothetical protein [Epilithonimonas lactis]KFC23621.1 hypothetical protein IO89_03310 [Epilithonimonas lactis]SEQ19644.1 Gram-negative bacterial TonB protein C-terminal [Epilithonimonas lactis]
MRKILFVLTLILSITVLSQETSQSTELTETEFDKFAEFSGGMDAFRNEFTKKFDSNKLAGSGQVSTQITFVVNEKGIVSDIKAKGKNLTFNEASVNAIKKIKGKWIPAMHNGIAVKSNYNFPLTMNFMN